MHGITDNGIIKTLDTLTIQTRLAQEGLVNKATFFTLWSGHFNETNGTYAAEIQYCKENNLPVDFELIEDDGVDFNIQQRTLKEIRDPNGADLIFSIFEMATIRAITTNSATIILLPRCDANQRYTSLWPAQGGGIQIDL